MAPKNTELLREEHLKQIEAHLTEIRQLAAACGLSRAEILSMFEMLDDN